MYRKTMLAFVVAAAAGFGAMSLSSTPASAQAGYCAYHPHDPVCLAAVAAPFVTHGVYHEHYDDHYPPLPSPPS